LKVLLTGASGFVGSHVLDSLRERGISTVLLLRPTSSRHFIEPHTSSSSASASFEIRDGSVLDPGSLRKAMNGITQIIHCAGATTAVHNRDFYQTNHLGTRNLIEAVNNSGKEVQRFVHISSLAAAGPSPASHPLKEDAPPRPVSEYGKSKLAAEMEVREHCAAPYVILRPSAVYGPRDTGFLPLFKAIKKHLKPAGTQGLSLVFVSDLANAIVNCLLHPAADRKTYFVASPEIVTARGMGETIAAQMNVWALPLPLPAAVLWPICAAQEIRARLTHKPTMLNRQKFAELRAPGWVCDASLLKRETGLECPTTMEDGISRTLRWYNENRWL
jgi:nucleoside-diphosphate-sugar epimerase